MMASHGDVSQSSSVTGEILNSLLDIFQTLSDEIASSDSCKDPSSALKKFITSTVKNTLKSCLPSIIVNSAPITNVQSHICSCNARHNRGEQYSRLNCMILHGDLHISPKLRGTQYSQKVVNFLNKCMSKSLGRLLSVGDIDTSHPLQARSGGNKPMTIIKFVRRDLRNDVLKRRKLMKKFGVNATEQLTEENITLFRKVQEFAGSENAWTDQAVIYMRTGDNTFRINSIEDLPFFSLHEHELIHADLPSDPPADSHPPERSSSSQNHNQGINRSANLINCVSLPSNAHQQDKRNQRLNNANVQAQIANLELNNQTVFPSIERATQKFINRKKHPSTSSYSNYQYNTEKKFYQNNRNAQHYSSHTNNRFYKSHPPPRYNNQVSQLIWGGGYAGDAYR